MKIDQLIVQYLYQNKQVALQGIGIIKINSAVVLPVEADYILPANAFLFEYNLKTTEDIGLVDYIVQETKKIRPLASSDLDSYALLAKQFLNLGKPLYIDGVGTIQKNQLGNYEFIAGQFITPKISDIPKQEREKRDESVSFETEKAPNNRERNLMIVLTAVGVLLVVLVLYYFVVVENTSAPVLPKQVATLNSLVKKDTIKKIITPTDTFVKKIADSSLTVVNAADPNSFSIVLKEYATESAAQKALTRLSNYGHHLQISKNTFGKYELAMPFKMPLADTLRIKDSLAKFFGGKPYLQQNSAATNP